MKHRLCKTASIVFFSFFCGLSLTHGHQKTMTTEVDLSLVDDFLGTPQWENSFAMDQITTVSFEEKSSLGSSVQTSLIRSRLKQNDLVEITSSDKNGQVFSTMDLKKSDWIAANGNWVRLFVNQTQSYGFQMSVQDIHKTSSKMTVNGQTITVPAMEVNLIGKSSAAEISQTYLITNQIRGVGGLLIRSDEQKNAFGKLTRTHRVLSVQDAK